MANFYTLTLVNRSNNDWDFCCFQEDPALNDAGVMSLAWFAFPVAPTSSVSFRWTIDYQFVWSQTGPLAPGVRFNASQTWDANIATLNSVDFTRKPSGAFSFQNLSQFGAPGTLYIHQDGTIPANTVAVGLNMPIEGAPPGGGSGTFVVSAQPNITTALTPHPTYWVSFGQYVSGQVLDVRAIGQKAQVRFPVNVYEMYAILGPDNQWTVVTQQALNAAFLASGGDAAHALLTDLAPLK